MSMYRETEFCKQGLFNVWFFKKDGLWYSKMLRYTNEVLIPGAAAILDSFYKDILHQDDIQPNSTTRLFAVVDVFGPSWTHEPPYGILDFTRVSHDEDGATYKITGSFAEELGINEQTIHLSNLIHAILRGHPLRISLCGKPSPHIMAD